MRRYGWVLALLVLLAFVGLLMGGLWLTTTGIGNWVEAREAYDVTFTDDEPGDECGDHGLIFDVDDGERLFCSHLPGGSRLGPPEPPQDFDGFSDEEFADVLLLSQDLGVGGLSSADQDQIRERIDQIVSTIPPAERAHPDGGKRAAWQMLGGIAMLAVVATPFVLLAWTR